MYGHLLYFFDILFLFIQKFAEMLSTSYPHLCINRIVFKRIIFFISFILNFAKIINFLVEIFRAASDKIKNVDKFTYLC